MRPYNKDPFEYTEEVETLRESFLLAKNQFGKFSAVAAAVSALMPAGGLKLTESTASRFAAAGYNIEMTNPHHLHWLKFMREWVDIRQEVPASSTTTTSGEAAGGRQGLSLDHFSGQLERLCEIGGTFRGCLGGV